MIDPASEAEALSHSLTAFRRARDDFELSASQLATLMLLDAEGGSTVGDLAADLGRPLSATSRLLDQLVRRGLVGRQEDERDRRVKRVALAPRGQELVRGVQRRRSEAQLAIMAALSGPSAPT
jgi:DNA-binding MarR family transcriptional regulator